MVMPKDIARSYPKRGLTADVGFRSEPTFVGDGSVYFDGSSDYAETAASSDLAVGDTFTLTAWVWLNPNPSGSSKYAFRVGDTGAPVPHIASIGVFGGANPGFYCYNGSGSMSSSVTCDSARWYHVASVIKSGAGNSQLFVDGIDVTNSHSVVFNVTSASSKIRIGDWNTGGNDWEGYIANACLFTESLTEAQVRQVMRASDYASHAAISTVEAFYPLSADFNDSTGSHNATLTGSVSFGVNRPQLPRGLDLARGAAMARVYTGRCVDFDGSTDFLDMGTGVDKNYTTRSDRASFSVWFNTDQTSIPAFIYQNRTQIVTDRPECETHLFITTAQGLTFDGEGAAVLIPITNLTIGKWHHFVGIADDTDGPIKAYLDGVLYDTISPPQAGANGSELCIGARNNAPVQVFNGQLSNFKIFNVELTQDQVRELYHNPEMIIPTGVSANNLRRHYPLCAYNDTGGMGGRYEIDQGVEGVNGEYGGSPVMAFAQPVPCPQLGLQQSATRVYFENNATRADATLGAAPGTTCTMSAWVMVESTGNYQYIFTQGTSAAAIAWFGIAKNNSDNKLYTLQGGVIAAYSSLQLSGYGEWNHVVAMTKSTAPYVRFFINGVEDTSINDISMAAYNLTSTSVSIGGNPVYANHTQGFLNDCAIWDVELSDPEVASLYNSGVQGMDVSTVQSANLKGWWKCDDLTSFKDYSGNGVNATLTGSVVAASFPENASGSTIVGDFSMKRKGVSVLNAPGSGRATLAANSSLLPTTGGGYTLCAFVRLQSTNDDAAVIMSTSTGVNEWGTFYEGSTNKYKIVLSDGTTNILDRAFSGTVTDSEWHHIAWTIQLDATTATGETYIDGTPDLSFTRSSFNTPPTPSEFAIGYDPGNADKQANAAIACLRIYQSVLSANEIKQVYSSDLRLIKGLENE